jgi:hypothetical protein
MYYVFSFCEATTGTLSFGKVLWNGKEVTLGVGDYGANNKIVSLTTNATPPQVDTTISGQAYIYGFINGSSSGVNTGGTSAITILSDAGIPVADRWTSTDTMTNTVADRVTDTETDKETETQKHTNTISVTVTVTVAVAITVEVAVAVAIITKVAATFAIAHSPTQSHTVPHSHAQSHTVTHSHTHRHTHTQSHTV